MKIKNKKRFYLCVFAGIIMTLLELWYITHFPSKIHSQPIDIGDAIKLSPVFIVVNTLLMIYLYVKR